MPGSFRVCVPFVCACVGVGVSHPTRTWGSSPIRGDVSPWYVAGLISFREWNRFQTPINLGEQWIREQWGSAPWCSSSYTIIQSEHSVLASSNLENPRKGGDPCVRRWGHFHVFCVIAACSSLPHDYFCFRVLVALSYLAWPVPCFSAFALPGIVIYIYYDTCECESTEA